MPHDQDALLFFDEVDSFLSKRVTTGRPYSTIINQHRSILMQELNQVDGVVILMANLFGNYDPALLRHLHFRIQNPAMCRMLFAHHPPNPDRVTADYAVLAALKLDLSRKDIVTICLNAIYAGSKFSNPHLWLVTQVTLELETAKAGKAKAEHLRKRTRFRG